MSSLSLPVNSRQLVVKFLGVKSYTQVFNCIEGQYLNPHDVQGSTIYIFHVTRGGSFAKLSIAV